MLVPMAIVLWMMLAIHMGAIAIVFVLRRFFCCWCGSLCHIDLSTDKKNMTFCRPSTVRLLGLHSVVSYIVLVAITCPEVCTKCVCVRNQESWWCDMFARSCCVLSYRICNFPCRHGLIYCGRRERMQNMHGARLSTQPSNCWCLRLVVGKLHKFS